MPDVRLMKRSAVPLSDEEERGVKEGDRGEGIGMSWDDKLKEEQQRKRCEDSNEPLNQRTSRKELKRVEVLYMLMNRYEGESRRDRRLLAFESRR